jgi:hypothetical protein
MAKGHIPDPLRRLKLQLQQLLATMDIRSCKRVALTFDLKESDVRDFFNPKSVPNERYWKVLHRLMTELGLELVTAPTQMLEALPLDAQTTLHLAKPTTPDYYPKGGIYASLSDEKRDDSE